MLGLAGCGKRPDSKGALISRSSLKRYPDTNLEFFSKLFSRLDDAPARQTPFRRLLGSAAGLNALAFPKTQDLRPET